MCLARARARSTCDIYISDVASTPGHAQLLSALKSAGLGIWGRADGTTSMGAVHVTLLVWRASPSLIVVTYYVILVNCCVIIDNAH